MPSHEWIPRIEFDALPEPLKASLAPMVGKLGYLGEFFKAGANAPKALEGFLGFADSLKPALAFDIAETVVLTVSTWAESRYERNQHERLCLRSGIGREWIESVEAMAPQASAHMTKAQRAVQAFTIRAVETRGLDASAEFDALAEHFSPEQAIAITLLVGRYVAHALLVNALQLAPPVPSIFEDSGPG